jgi:hypothetical protein
MVPAATALGILMNPKTADAEAELVEVQAAAHASSADRCRGRKRRG